MTGWAKRKLHFSHSESAGLWRRQCRSVGTFLSHCLLLGDRRTDLELVVPAKMCNKNINMWLHMYAIHHNWGSTCTRWFCLENTLPTDFVFLQCLPGLPILTCARITTGTECRKKWSWVPVCFGKQCMGLGGGKVAFLSNKTTKPGPQWKMQRVLWRIGSRTHVEVEVWKSIIRVLSKRPFTFTLLMLSTVPGARGTSCFLRKVHVILVILFSVLYTYTQVLIMCVSFFHMITVIVFFQQARNFAPLQTANHPSWATCTTLHVYTTCSSQLHRNICFQPTSDFFREITIRAIQSFVAYFTRRIDDIQAFWPSCKRRLDRICHCIDIQLYFIPM